MWIRSSSDGQRRRSRATWAALITAIVACPAIVVVVLLPVLGAIGAAQVTTFGAVRVPVGAIAASIVISYLIGLGFLSLTLVMRRGAPAWISAVAAIVATAVGSVWPLIATATASVAQVEDVIPFIQQLIGQVIGTP